MSLGLRKILYHVASDNGAPPRSGADPIFLIATDLQGITETSNKRKFVTPMIALLPEK